MLHTDAALLPRDRARLVGVELHGRRQRQRAAGQRPVSVSYLINHLQPLPFATPVIVSLNPHREPGPETVIGDYDYAHPLFDVAGHRRAAAPARRSRAGDRLWFCGAWGGYGFHEDGLKSGAGGGQRASACAHPGRTATDATEQAA